MVPVKKLTAASIAVLVSRHRAHIRISFARVCIREYTRLYIYITCVCVCVCARIRVDKVLDVAPRSHPERVVKGWQGCRWRSWWTFELRSLEYRRIQVWPPSAIRNWDISRAVPRFGFSRNSQMLDRDRTSTIFKRTVARRSRCSSIFYRFYLSGYMDARIYIHRHGSIQTRHFLIARIYPN